MTWALPVMPPEVTETVTVPGRWAVRVPVGGSTEATLGLLDVQTWEAGSAIGMVSGAMLSPAICSPVAVRVTWSPLAIGSLGPLTEIDARAGSTVYCRSPSSPIRIRPKW